MNVLMDRDAFVVSNMGFDDSDGPIRGWYVHDTFKASGLYILRNFQVPEYFLPTGNLPDTAGLFLKFFSE